MLFFSVVHTWLVCLGRERLHYLTLEDCAVRHSWQTRGLNCVDHFSLCLLLARSKTHSKQKSSREKKKMVAQTSRLNSRISASNTTGAFHVLEEREGRGIRSYSEMRLHSLADTVMRRVPVCKRQGEWLWSRDWRNKPKKIVMSVTRSTATQRITHWEWTGVALPTAAAAAEGAWAGETMLDGSMLSSCLHQILLFPLKTCMTHQTSKVNAFFKFR